MAPGQLLGGGYADSRLHSHRPLLPPEHPSRGLARGRAKGPPLEGSTGLAGGRAHDPATASQALGCQANMNSILSKSGMSL